MAGLSPYGKNIEWQSGFPTFVAKVMVTAECASQFVLKPLNCSRIHFVEDILRSSGESPLVPDISLFLHPRTLVIVGQESAPSHRDPPKQVSMRQGMKVNSQEMQRGIGHFDD